MITKQLRNTRKPEWIVGREVLGLTHGSTGSRKNIDVDIWPPHSRAQRSRTKSPVGGKSAESQQFRFVE